MSCPSNSTSPGCRIRPARHARPKPRPLAPAGPRPARRPAMTPLAAGVDYVDLEFLGHPQIIATAILQGAAGVALVDPGPTTTLEQLTASLKRKGISLADVRQVVLTHIHLDHAGATGAL